MKIGPTRLISFILIERSRLAWSGPAIGVLAIALVGMGRASTSTPTPTPTPPPFKVEMIAGGFPSPVFVTHAGDGSGRLFVVEQGGKIKIIDSDGSVRTQPFLDITSRVTNGGERGLLGLAFHPNYSVNGRFFVHYTAKSPFGDSIVAEYGVSQADMNVADSQNETIIFGPVDQPEGNHNAGMIAFSPGDGMFYISYGDGGGANDQHGTIGNAQDLSTVLGSMLRIDIDHPDPGMNYGIPNDNPFFGDMDPNTRDEIYAWGLRNPWRFSFDRVPDDQGAYRLFVGDVGQGEREEVDIVVRAGNYGWRCREGLIATPSSSTQTPNCNTTGFIEPIADYMRVEGISVIGGYVYRGLDFPNLFGAYVFGDYGSGKIWTLEQTAPGQWVRTQILQTGRMSSFGEDEQGEIYLCDYNGGRIWRLIDNRPFEPPLAVRGDDIYDE